MNNFGVNDEILNIWVGTKDNMNLKIKVGKFNVYAFLCGGFYYLYRKMYLIGILYFVLVFVWNLFCGLLTIFSDLEKNTMTLISSLGSLAIPIISGFVFYPLYRRHIVNTLNKYVNQYNSPIQVAQTKGGVSGTAVGIAIAVLFVGVFILARIIIAIFSFIYVFLLYDYNDYTNEYYEQREIDDLLIDDYSFNL